MHCDTTVDPSATWVGSWYALEKAYAEGYVNSIGVSNFNHEELSTFMDQGFFSVGPHAVQNFAQPGSVDKEVLEFCKRNEVAFQPYASLRNLYDNSRHTQRKIDLLSSLSTISQAHGVTASEVALRFLVQAGMTPIPRSTNREHMEANLRVFGWELLSDEMDQLW